MTSGLESIALAVAHLERVRSSEGHDVSERSARISGSPDESPVPSAANSERQKGDRYVAGRSNTLHSSPSQHHHFSSFPPNLPFGTSAPRIVSIDNLNPSGLVGIPNDNGFYPEGGNFHHLSSLQSHHDGPFNSPHHGHYQHHLHQHVLQQNVASTHQLQQELMYRLPNYQHGTQPLVVMQVPVPHQHIPHPSGHQQHKQHVSHTSAHRQSPTAADNSTSQSSAQMQPHGTSNVSTPTVVSPLPTAVLDLADNLEDFLSMELDHTVYPAVPKPSEVIVQVQKNDVLLGRGGETNHHIGNIQYRQLVKLCQPAYLEAKRRDKPKIAERIVHAVRCLSGRFLKKDPETSTWRDVGNTRAREKTSQALREGAPELRTGGPGDFATGVTPTSPRMGIDQVSAAEDLRKNNLIGFVTPSALENVKHHHLMNMHLNPSYAGVTSTPVFDPSVYASPSKKARIDNSFQVPGSHVQPSKSSAPTESPAASVSATVSGDDEENSANTPGPRSGSITYQNFPKDFESRPQGEKRALPRLKLLKKRFEQCVQKPGADGSYQGK
jgi:hypothetical protein